MSIVFEVIDQECQAADNSFFIPQVLLTGRSTTKFATVVGFPEFGTPSTPPKKYLTATLTGTSERIGFTTEQTPRQCAGAKYVYNGVGQFNFQGNITSKYTKNFFAQCAKQFWPFETLQALPGAITTGNPPARFVGFCWTDWNKSCGVCSSIEANWTLIGDLAINHQNSLFLDLAGFMHLPSDVVTTPTTWSLNTVFHGITTIGIDTQYDAELFGTDLNNYQVAVGSTTYSARAVVTNPPNLEFPATALGENSSNLFIGTYINFTDTSNYSAVLTDECTDAQALASAVPVIGTGTVAQNQPRTTGFTSIFTDVVFTLNCRNLVSGKDYVVSVDLWDKTIDVNPETGEPATSTTTRQYVFTATGGTHAITDTIPTPDPGHTIQVKHPTIQYSV